MHQGKARQRAALAGDLDPAGVQAHHEEDEVSDETGGREHLSGEEVGGGDPIPVGRQERLPGSSLSALGRRLDAMVIEDPLDRVAADLVRSSGLQLP